MSIWEYKNIKIFNADVLDRNNFKANFYDLAITSPPYNVGINYENEKIDDTKEYNHYLEFTRKWLENCYFWGKDKARLCINIPVITNKFGHRNIFADISNIAMQVGWKFFTTIIWNKNNVNNRTAWGSFCSASAPSIICPAELILVLYKNEWLRKEKNKISDISKQNFIDWTIGIWNIAPESKIKIGHPAPFPRELVYRCIKLFSYVGDTIFDPFCGSGTTMIEANVNNRKGVGLEINKKFCNLIKKRIFNNDDLFGF